MNEFEKIYEWTNEKLTEEIKKIKEFKRDIRQSELLIIAMIIVCIIISFFAPSATAKYVFITVAILMFMFCTFYTFKNERKIVARQNKFSDFALSELAIHINDGFVYEKDEELSGSYYRKSGFNRIYKELKSQGVISGNREGHNISLSNIIVNSPNKELFRGIFSFGTLNQEFHEIDVMTVNSNNNKKEKYEIPNTGLYLYAESIQEARKIVNDDVIEYVKNFAQDTKYKLEFMINKNMVYFRFFDKDILTKPIANDKETKEFLFKYYRIIEFMAGFINLIEK